MDASNSFVESVEVFFKTAYWLNDEDNPSMTGLMKAAEALDKRFQGNVLAEYGKLHRYLMKLKPAGDNENYDEMEADLNRD